MNTNQSEPTQKTILIVDDIPENLQLLSHMLKEHGYAVRATTSGPGALKSVQIAPPDIILLDITMPGMNGYEVCRLLKHDAQTAHIPIIFISALDEVMNKVEAFKVGGVDYVTKPFHVDEVLARVKTHLSLRRMQQQLQEQNSQLQQQIIERTRAEATLRDVNQQLITLVEKLEYMRDQLREQSIRDPLTNLFNRRYLEEILEREISRSLRHNQEIGFIMLDIDHFKQYNDTYGHDGGDTLLRHMSAFLQHHIRTEDIACRYGGEEFLLVLPGACLDHSRRRAEDLCASVRRITVEHQGQVLGTITASFGVAGFPYHGTSATDVINAADQALYRAKHGGRNRVVMAERS